jgi:cysteine-rich repeat protein
MFTEHHLVPVYADDVSLYRVFVPFGDLRMFMRVTPLSPFTRVTVTDQAPVRDIGQYVDIPGSVIGDHLIELRIIPEYSPAERVVTIILVVADVCGNGLRPSGSSDACDDGNDRDGDGCSRSCVLEV